MVKWSIANNSELYQNKRFDAEFFKPEYATAEKSVRSGNYVELGRLGKFIPGPFGSAFIVSNYDHNSKYRYIRGKDVKPFMLQEDDNVYMPEKDFERLKKYAVAENDLMISVVGTLGNVAIIHDDTCKGIFSCKSTIFRNARVNPYYLLTYLNSQYGKDILLRRQRGAVQTGLNIEDLKSVPVPIIDEGKQIEIGNNVKKAISLFTQSKKLLDEAHKTLQNHLGIENSNAPKSKIFGAKFSDLLANSRTDAEFFHHKYDLLLNKIYGYRNGFSKLSNIGKRIDPNFSPKSFSRQYFQYIEIGDIEISDGFYSSNWIKSNEAPANAKKRLFGNEIIISTVRPTRGAISIIDLELTETTVCSGAFYVIKLKDQRFNELIWLYLRTIKSLFEKFSGGTSYPTIDEHYLSKIPIPNFELDIALHISDIVRKSKTAKREAIDLLKSAENILEKELVEQAIPL